MSDAVAAAPTSGHELLLGLAGWVDDDLLAIGRELVAVGEEAGALELLVASLAAARTVLPHPVRAGLGDAVERRIGADLARLLPPGAPLPDRTAHAFAPDAGAADTAEQIGEILDGLTVVARSGARAALTWRTTPAGAAPGPLPHPVVLLVLDEAGPAEVLAYQVGAALARSGVPASVEAVVEGSALPPYQRAALAASRPAGRSADLTRAGLSFAGPDESWAREYTEDSDATVTAAPTVATVSGPYESLLEHDGDGGTHGAPDDSAEPATGPAADESDDDPLSGNGAVTSGPAVDGSHRAEAGSDDPFHGAESADDAGQPEDRAKDLLGTTDPDGPGWTEEPASGTQDGLSAPAGRPGTNGHDVEDTARTARQATERAGSGPGADGTQAGGVAPIGTEGSPISPGGPDPARFDPARNAVDRNVHGGPGVTARPAVGPDRVDEQTGPPAPAPRPGPSTPPPVPQGPSEHRPGTAARPGAAGRPPRPGRRAGTAERGERPPLAAPGTPPHTPSGAGPGRIAAQ